MANDLNATLRAVLQGPIFRHNKIWSWQYQLDDGSSPVDVGSRVVELRPIELTLANWHPNAADSAAEIQYAGLELEVTNADGYFSEGHANEIWGGLPPTSWKLVVSIYEHASDPDGALFAELIGDIRTVPKLGATDTAILSAVAEIATHMAELQDYDAMTFIVDTSGLTSNRDETDNL